LIASRSQHKRLILGMAIISRASILQEHFRYFQSSAPFTRNAWITPRIIQGTRTETPWPFVKVMALWLCKLFNNLVAGYRLQT
jgi:hypothetical protein